MRSRIPPFEIAVPYAVLDDLSARLARTRWPTPIPADDQARHCETRAVSKQHPCRRRPALVNLQGRAMDKAGQRYARPMEIRLDHCVVHVSERQRSNGFYRDVLGAELVGDANGVSMYRFGEQQLNVHGPGLHPEPVARLPVQPGGSDLCFVWPGPIEGAIDHLRTRGLDIELGPVRRRGARGEGTSVYFRDPDGSLLEFISYN